jgi:hypothetical protein
MKMDGIEIYSVYFHYMCMYTVGWLIKLRLIESADLDYLMDEDQYAEHCASEEKGH